MTRITDRVQSVRELHYEERGHCAECTWRYPCKTIEVLDDRNAPPSARFQAERRAAHADVIIAQARAFAADMRCSLNADVIDYANQLDDVLKQTKALRWIAQPGAHPDDQPKDTT